MNTINLNQRVKVKLNEKGLDIYNKFFEDLGLKPPMLVDRTLIIELWDLAHIFGKSFGNGAPMVFESTELVIFE